MNRCGIGQCAVHVIGRGGGGAGWLAILDSIALWILAIAAILFLLGLRRRTRGRPGQGRGNAAYPARSGGPASGDWAGWGPGAAQGAAQASGQGAGQGAGHLTQAEATLAERFSRGEITADEYRDGLSILRGQSPSSGQPAQSQPGPGDYGQPQPEPPSAAPPSVG